MPVLRAPRRGAIVLLALGLALAPGSAPAQQPDSLRAGVATAPRDTVTALQLPQPPLSPTRAFLTSLALPGYAQARLNRPTASALFAAIEAVGIIMTRKSLSDLRIAQRYVGDSVPLRFETDPVTGELVRDDMGEPVVVAFGPGRYSEELVRARRTHLEDWLAVLIFNHLFAGADAFVVAQLWDVPAGVSLTATPGRAAVTASLRW